MADDTSSFATEHERILATALRAGLDPHTAWAAHRLGKKVEDVTFDERQAYKMESFHLLYSTTFMFKVYDKRETP
jgi:DNA polymerase I-like protein with 3'-5' exonuclease and polymerase domains